MNMQFKRMCLAATVAAMNVVSVSVHAQAHDGHGAHSSAAPTTTPTMDHDATSASGMNHGAAEMNHGAGEMNSGASEMNHGAGQMNQGAGEANQSASETAHDAGGMDHGDMQMQGGSAPPDGRDPDAYSGGYERNAGKYALPLSEKLMMSDTHNFGAVEVDRLEYVRARGDEWAVYEGEAWYGSTYNRGVIKAKGEVASGKLQESETQLLWRHAVSTFWDTELGLRFDHGHGAPNREWLAFGVRGVSPYWFELEATGYVGPSGRMALALKAEYDILLTQKLYLQPSVEMNFYSKDDKRWGVGSGLTDGTAGLRLKYEITRQFVPYVGVEWSSTFGKAADYAREAGDARHETRFVTGLSFRF